MNANQTPEHTFSDPGSPEEHWERSDILSDLDSFTKFVRELASYMVFRRRSSADFDVLRRLAWERLSKQHLESVVDVRSFGHDGSLRPIDIEATPSSYDPDV
jgi:hypothetical protein